MAQDNGSRVIWFFAGAAVGAAVALLYAPQPGEHTRRLIKRKASHGRDVISERGRDLMDKGRSLYDQGRSMADDAASMLERGRQFVED